MAGGTAKHKHSLVKKSLCTCSHEAEAEKNESFMYCGSRCAYSSSPAAKEDSSEVYCPSSACNTCLDFERYGAQVEVVSDTQALSIFCAQPRSLQVRDAARTAKLAVHDREQKSTKHAGTMVVWKGS
ncbi:hypothetical protein TRVL_03184 [Trypanosoma vivax]|uniref:Uncharacterized protein n=1 Tax=Trypanosoma vivax (strain Y486) TaxID=1055687 RepID=G0UBA2_TRYVY|nr:hypothetical protein TRVL_03184 [Trypanosoma vivax]CCC53089.1 hypothetical protein TVY486_1105730 [Trypanosoma vivax Y486]